MPTSTMKIARWAAVPTGLMALLNIPAGPSASTTDPPAWVDWAGTLLGLLGMIAAIALFRRVSGARPAVIAISVLNAAGGVLAMAQGWDGGPVGLVLGVVAIALALAPDRESRPAARTSEI